jgi:hypothetical protein
LQRASLASLSLEVLPPTRRTSWSSPRVPAMLSMESPFLSISALPLCTNRLLTLV